MSNASRAAEAEARVRAAVERLSAAGRKVTLAAVVEAAGCSKSTAARALRVVRASPSPKEVRVRDPQPVPERPGGTVTPLEARRGGGTGIGRPCKLTPEAAERIAAAVADGVSREGAAQAVGVHRATLMHWLQLGREQAEGPYRDLADAIEKAEGACEREVVGVVRRAAESGNWQAGAWLLERKHPERYGRVDRLAVMGRVDTKVEVTVRYVDEADEPPEVIDLEPAAHGATTRRR